MNIYRYCKILLAIGIAFAGVAAQAQTTVLTVKADKPGAAIQPAMWGIFFEDINFAADGGIYAEMVKNRSFEFYEPMMGWKEQRDGGATGRVLVLNQSATKPANPRYAHFEWDASQGAYTLANEGFRGIGIKKDMQYNFSLLAKAPGGDVKLKVQLLAANGTPIGGTEVTISGNDWKRHTASFTATATEPKGKLLITFQGKGTLDADMISLFPNDTWKNRPGGLRADLIQLLADLKPGFVRFPGG